MKLPVFLSKPRWLSKDAAIRRAAVMHDSDSELVANLGRLAREDADADVRLAAMKRLADPGIVQGLAHDDVDPGVRTQARALWLDLLTGTHAASPPLVERLRLLKAQEDAELIVHIARNAPEAPMRQAALERTSRPAVLLERAINDGDPAIRVALVARIDDEAQLTRLVERARTSDKQVSRAARERIDALRIARGHDATVEQRARQLCEQLEQLIRNPAHADVEAQIAARWSAVEAMIPAPLQARYQTALNLLVASRSAPMATPEPNVETPSGDTAATEESIDAEAGDIDCEPSLEAVSTQADAEAVAAVLIAQARFTASLDEAKAEQRQKQEQQQALIGELDAALGVADAALEAGASSQAHAAKTRIDDLRRRIKAALPRALAQHLIDIDKRYAQLSEWQQWADNQRRRQLCEEIDAIAASGIHPDAVASRVREAQAEWTRLDAAEARTSAKPSSLARRFHGACRAAMAPTQDYFKKRQELRQSHAQQVNALLDRGAAFAEDSSDWAGIITLRREMVEALRSLDSVEPRERKALAARLKTSLDALDARVTRRDQDVEQAKAVLINEAEALATDTPQRGAVAAIRDLQQRWQRAGNGRRARDQSQWKIFRGAIDAVFAGLDAERTERSAREADTRTQAETLCTEFEALATAASPIDRGASGRLQAAWDALRVRDEDLNRRFAAAQSQLRAAAEQAERSRRHARFDTWLARYRLCRAAENKIEPLDALRARWNDAAATDIAATLLDARFEASLDGAPSDFDDEASAAARELLLELEFLAGIEPDAADREQRRVLQVERLAARMRGGQTQSPTDELADLMARWSALGPLPDAPLDVRLERGVAAVLDTLS
ncbi:MAG: hypothetical protein ABI748_00935 [Dokdonella sp.]